MRSHDEEHETTYGNIFCIFCMFTLIKLSLSARLWICNCARLVTAGCSVKLRNKIWLFYVSEQLSLPHLYHCSNLKCFKQEVLRGDFQSLDQLTIVLTCRLLWGLAGLVRAEITGHKIKHFNN